MFRVGKHDALAISGKALERFDVGTKNYHYVSRSAKGVGNCQACCRARGI